MMKATVSDLRLHRRDPQFAPSCQIEAGQRVCLVARSPAVPPSSRCAATSPAGEAAGKGEVIAPGNSLWRLSLAGIATDQVETVAFLLLAGGAAVSILHGFWHLDYFLVNWPSFVELAQRVFS
jgi:hypothetical protein